ncbi:flagellar hook protein FlgE [Clostridium formicaceticum]|uniref:Flagellar hook protein FlgE n=1 Tax=Clostridium formicaceticum TaxID=1497 RepID=A0AAC9RLP8_9CLOT|nr:flagellar hook protein FlgE [Clostridium formicaceticum]AOY77314.1 hypothetical protein BJL90_16535 [Clostridium formicaceticum]ARE87857.1 Flagellar hook protein FlgE [Clostridium formicaceticum]
MMRSMFSAVSGLRAHQTKMDVIGNNIANVNTIGFKGSRMTFQEVMNQTIQGASAARDGRGGTNPQQVGLGIDVAAMDTFHIQGTVERTEYMTDVMISGNGFFIVSDDANALNQYYTRAGSFSLDASGNLVTPDGFKVLGFRADEEGVLQPNLSGLVISKSATFNPMATDRVTMKGNLDAGTKRFALPADGALVANLAGFNGNQEALDAAGGPNEGMVYRAVLKDPDAAYQPNPNEDNYNPVVYQINQEFTDSVARETSYEVFDGLGGIHRIKQAYIRIEDDADGNSQFRVETFYLDKDGNMIHATGQADDPLTAPQNNILTFDAKGKLIAGQSMQLRIGEGLTNGAEATTFTLSHRDLTMFASSSTAHADETNGFPLGTLDDFTIAPTGEITGIFSNGERKLLGQIRLANFRNPAGLEKIGSNMYRATSNSGIPIEDNPGVGGLGTLSAGSLEMSNVDLSREIVTMIATQRGFQSNSRIITTSDEMLQEVVNMKR